MQEGNSEEAAGGPGRIKVLVVTYKRAKSLNENLRSLWAGAEDPDLIDVVVLSNHPDVEIDPSNQRENLRVIVNETRPANARGYLARDWNFGILEAFGDWSNPNQTAWCVLAQNDVTWLPGWDRALRNETRFDLISQPTGDQAIAMRIEAVRKVGFFDERFSVISCQEHDYLTRCALVLGDRASINDDHGGDMAISSWNPVGEVFTSATSSHEVEGDDAPNDSFFGEELSGLLIRKWGTTSGDMFYERARELPKRMGSPVPAEVNWYPHFWVGARRDRQPKFLAEYMSVSDGMNSSSWLISRLSRAYGSIGPRGQKIIRDMPGVGRLRHALVDREARRRDAGRS